MTVFAGVLECMPIEGTCGHAIYSGSEVMLRIPPEVWLPGEKATQQVLPGDLAYYPLRGGEHYGWPTDVAELCWFYDRDATPSMPDGPVAVEDAISIRSGRPRTRVIGWTGQSPTGMPPESRRSPTISPSVEPRLRSPGKSETPSHPD